MKSYPARTLQGERQQVWDIYKKQILPLGLVTGIITPILAATMRFLVQ